MGEMLPVVLFGPRINIYIAHSKCCDELQLPCKQTKILEAQI